MSDLGHTHRRWSYWLLFVPEEKLPKCIISLPKQVGISNTLQHIPFGNLPILNISLSKSLLLQDYGGQASPRWGRFQRLGRNKGKPIFVQSSADKTKSRTKGSAF